MRYDDRLSTVLNQPVSGETMARIQFRQLLDLLGTGSEAQDPGTDAAYMRLTELGQAIPAHDRAAALAEPALRLRSPRLVAHLAEGEPRVAAAALAAARLEEAQWLDLIPALPLRARGFVRHRRDLTPPVDALLRRFGIFDQGLPPADDAVAVEEEAPVEGIGAIVRRIERFRQEREQQEAAAALNDAPLLPLGDLYDVGPAHLDSFDFATDAEGRIVWSDRAAAPMAVGLRLATADPESPAQAARGLLAAFRRRQPVRAEPVTITGAPAITGDWQADAAPRFDRPGGRFIGYCGRLRRPAPAREMSAGAPAAAGESEADRMRQLLHELRTPVNAIQGFAEVIQQQLFGPTPHEYRALAATIASDGARMLAGFEELDRLVKLDAGAMELDEGDSDLAAVVAMTTAQLEGAMTRRGSNFALAPIEAPAPVAMARVEVERLVWRLLATLAGGTAPGETLRIKLRTLRDGTARLSLRLPASLAERDDTALFHAAVAPGQASTLGAGMFGAGFALRLAMAEARAAGGDLERRDGRLRLTLPAPLSAGVVAPQEDSGIL